MSRGTTTWGDDRLTGEGEKVVRMVSANSDARHEPSSGAELKTKAVPLDGREIPLLDKRGMSPEQAAWETVLEENLGPFYLPRYLDCKHRGVVTAWDYVKDDPTLPRALLIGDSISRGYTVATRHALAGTVNVHRAPENCGPTANAMQKLDLWLGARRWDVIHFNFGIHDRNTPPADYLSRLEQIADRLAATGASLIWATTTPIGPGAELYEASSSERSNGLATPFMERHGVRVNDLYALTLPNLAEIQIPKDCHFHEAGYELMGRQVADVILAALRDRGRAL